MSWKSVLLLVASLTQIQAAPFQFPPSSQSSGTAGGTITSGTTQTQQGVSNVKTSQANAAGATSGAGASSTNSAFTTNQRQSGPHGSSDTSNTGANSVQTSQGGAPVPPHHAPLPMILPPAGVATGTASGQTTFGSSTGPNGFESKITSISSQAGGSSSGQASSVNQANASHSSSNGVHGSSQNSNTNAVSNQFSGR